MFISSFTIPFYSGPKKLINMDHVTTIENGTHGIVLLNHGSVVDTLRIADGNYDVAFNYLEEYLSRSMKPKPLNYNVDSDFFLQP